jgi:hypothetical protein
MGFMPQVAYQSAPAGYGWMIKKEMDLWRRERLFLHSHNLLWNAERFTHKINHLPTF